MISVLMCVYNERLDWIKQAVQSILNQTYKDFEYIIVIDNPMLEQEKLIFLQEMEKKDDRIVLCYNEENIGLMKSLNRGIELVHGEYIARMDADDISFPERLEKEIDYLEKNDFDMISAYRIDIDEEGEEICQNSGVFNNPDKHLRYSNFIVHPLVLVKTEVMCALNGYRDFYNSEDYDMWLRILSAGYKIGILKEHLIYYRIRRSSMSLKNTLETFYITKYQQKLYKERVRKGRDSFSEENLRKYIQSKNISEKKIKTFVSFTNMFNQSVKEAKRHNIIFVPHLIRAFFLYPSMWLYRVSQLINMMR